MLKTKTIVAKGSGSTLEAAIANGITSSGKDRRDILKVETARTTQLVGGWSVSLILTIDTWRDK